MAEALADVGAEVGVLSVTLFITMSTPTPQASLAASYASLSEAAAAHPKASRPRGVHSEA